MINVMDVNNRNILFSKDEKDRDDLWLKITEYRDQPWTFHFSFRDRIYRPLHGASGPISRHVPGASP